MEYKILKINDTFIFVACIDGVWVAENTPYNSIENIHKAMKTSKFDFQVVEQGTITSET